MHCLPLEIYSVESVRAIDRRAIREAGVTGMTLMTLAGEFAARESLQLYPGARRWQVLCGPGNNGGDGYVLARAARDAGIDVDVIALSDPAALAGDAAQAYSDWLAQGGTVTRWQDGLVDTAALSVDAMFGSGLSRPLEGAYAAAVDALNRHPAPVVALDIPSGIHGDTGERLGAAVLAATTITFVGLKAGLFLGEGYVATGRLRYTDLDIPDACRGPEQPVLLRTGRQLLRELLPARRRDAHKGDFGHVLVVGGGPGMPGAARLCGEAALRSGAGKVTLATHPSHAAAIGAVRPELMSRSVSGADELLPMLADADVVAFGPGLGTSDWARAMFRVVASAEGPAVWDADALNLLAGSETAVAGSPRELRVITPHPGEAGRLLGTSAASVQKDRPGAVRALQARYGGVAVLKGAGSLVAARQAIPRICLAGNPGMAAAGMGDVLTGVIAALIAQGLATADAAAAGVAAHALAGDRAARGGMRGMLASDVLGELQSVLNPVPGTSTGRSAGSVG